MKQETVKRIVAMIEKEEPNTNILLMTSNENAGVSSILCGDDMSIAKAILVTMFDYANPKYANDIYGIVKNIIVNLLNNPSPMSNDIVAVLKEKIKEYEK